MEYIEWLLDVAAAHEASGQTQAAGDILLKAVELEEELRDETCIDRSPSGWAIIET